MKYYKNTNNELFVDAVVENNTGLIEITREEFDTIIIENNKPTVEQQAQNINNAIQSRLDSKAQEFRYDNMMSARSYTGYTNPFQVEAQALSVWASECWVVAGQIEADVLSGARPMPTVDEVLSELPIYGA